MSVFSSLLPYHLAIQHVQNIMTSSCDLSHDYSSTSLFSSQGLLPYPIFASLFQRYSYDILATLL